MPVAVALQRHSSLEKAPGLSKLKVLTGFYNIMRKNVRVTGIDVETVGGVQEQRLKCTLEYGTGNRGEP